jgi:hypothetical protein
VGSPADRGQSSRALLRRSGLEERLPALSQTPYRRGTMMLNASLSFLNRGKTKQVCRICREITELKTEGLCADCAWVKAQIQLRFHQQPPRPSDNGDSSKQEEECKRSGCLCAACNRRILDLHPFRPSDPAQAHTREIHFHPRCHKLWLEAVGGLDARPGNTNE